MPAFLRAKRALKNVALAAGEPLLEDLMAAEAVGPDGGGNIAPEGFAIEVDVEGCVVFTAGLR